MLMRPILFGFLYSGVRPMLMRCLCRPGYLGGGLGAALGALFALGWNGSHFMNGVCSDLGACGGGTTSSDVTHSSHMFKLSWPPWLLFTQTGPWI